MAQAQTAVSPPKPEPKPEPVKVEAPKPRLAVAPLPRDRCQYDHSGQMTTLWHVTPPHGTSFETVLAPEFYAHVAEKIRPGDRINVHAEDGSWLAELHVRMKGQNWVKVHALRHVEFGAAMTPEPDDGYAIEWRGTVKKHRVIRKSDQAELRSGFDTEEAAQVWLRDYKKALRN